MNDLLLPNTVSQNRKTAIPHITIKITELPLEKSSILQYRRLPCPPPKNRNSFFLSLFSFFFELEKFLAFCHYGDDYIYDYDDDYDYHNHRYYYYYYYYSSTAKMVPSWNVTITYKTSSTLTVRWTNFPLSVPIQRVLVKYKEKNSNINLIYHVSIWNNFHYTGNMLRGYSLYEVNVFAVVNTSGNETLYKSSGVITARTSEGGK